ncbi:unnamed protein product [Moneuplotes crassus]|uniref:Uncharacterized protein n=1 Tax=Euplotes crassus TaxID=5936 RepID=A0AAD1XAV3_EUPCR|nr:unnamed protein product [Moneuplotes crassus]
MIIIPMLKSMSENIPDRIRQIMITNSLDKKKNFLENILYSQMDEAVPTKAAIPKRRVPKRAFLSAELPSAPSLKIWFEKDQTPLTPVVCWKKLKIEQSNNAFL